MGNIRSEQKADRGEIMNGGAPVHIHAHHAHAHARLGKDVLKWNVSKTFEPQRVAKFSARQSRNKKRRAQENSGARAAAAQNSMDLGAGQSNY